jgi:MerR family transcriptional regulator, light-induced transcriptional regulator
MSDGHACPFETLSDIMELSSSVPIAARRRRALYQGQNEVDPLNQRRSPARRVKAPALPEARDGTNGAESGSEGAGADVERFVACLIAGKDTVCRRMVLDTVAACEDPQRVAGDLLTPAARLVGDYWRRDVCDFMQVTMAMTQIQRLFWSIVSDFPPQSAIAGSGPRILLSPIPGEAHAFGLSIVEDAFRRAGWLVDYCEGGNERELHLLAAAGDYAVIGLSMSGETFVPTLRATLRQLRQGSRSGAVSIMLGGSIFVDKPELAFDAGADILAMDAAEALRFADAVVAGRGVRSHMHVAV